MLPPFFFRFIIFILFLLLDDVITPFTLSPSKVIGQRVKGPTPTSFLSHHHHHHLTPFPLLEHLPSRLIFLPPSFELNSSSCPSSLPSASPLGGWMVGERGGGWWCGKGCARVVGERRVTATQKHLLQSLVYEKHILQLKFKAKATKVLRYCCVLFIFLLFFVVVFVVHLDNIPLGIYKKKCNNRKEKKTPLPCNNTTTQGRRKKEEQSKLFFLAPFLCKMVKYRIKVENTFSSTVGPPPLHLFLTLHNLCPTPPPPPRTPSCPPTVFLLLLLLSVSYIVTLSPNAPTPPGPAHTQSKHTRPPEKKRNRKKRGKNTHTTSPFLPLSSCVESSLTLSLSLPPYYYHLRVTAWALI